LDECHFKVLPDDVESPSSTVHRLIEYDLDQGSGSIIKSLGVIFTVVWTGGPDRAEINLLTGKLEST
jgi:hypothetical protein